MNGSNNKRMILSETRAGTINRIMKTGTIIQINEEKKCRDDKPNTGSRD
jgi:hypothetical protein